MASKPKSKTFIVQHRGRIQNSCMILGSYIVGARNAQEAEELLRNVIGKHAKVKVYYEDKNKVVPHGSVERRVA